MPSERVQRRIDSLLDQADEAVVVQDWGIVRSRAESVLAFDPENEDAAQYIHAANRAQNPSEVSEATAVQPGSATQDSPIDQPSSFASGRYTVSKFLGEGGKKKVYLAHDNTLDRDVAFALIKTEGLDETSRERVRREAQAMGRMGTHPCIMPIYDLGEEPDAQGIAQPFMVQPVMVGGDVEGLVEDADGPLQLEDALRIATQTAQGLVFAHSKGIVHRDLKPGNVWLDEDGAAKIGDFGLAIATDRSRLTVEKVMVGTVNYMPPEQATGGEVTAKADLYSLGAMLYEMCTGRVPFMGDDDIAVISQHVNTPPVAPSWHNTQIPKTLDSLILRLLAKDPSERPGDADEVLAALEAVDLTAVSDEQGERETNLDSMAGGVFVGRHREMDQLKAAFEEVLSGKGRMVTLVGEPGIGKTRTAQELATYASMRGAQVLWGRSYESGGAPPYWPWVQAIRSHVSSIEPQALRTQLGATAPVIAEVVPDVREKLPDLPAPASIDDPESARFRLFDSIATFLKNTASATPLILMLEDLHWSDKPSLMLLEFVARELANSRIMIVGNYRDMELNRRHPLSVTLGDLSRERLFERVVLRGLQKHDVERFIEIAAGITPPPALVETVFRQTEGNPLFVTETVRLLIQEGDITSGQSSKGGTTSWEIRIPEGVREVIGRRLDRLSERCNEVLTIAAVIGRQFRFDVLKMLMDNTTDGQMLDAMDEALSARIIEEFPSDVGFYQFTHAQMQETLTQELSLTRRVRLHARIAGALEDFYGPKAPDHAAELATHYGAARTELGTEKFLLYSVISGEAALDSFAFEDARDIFEFALEESESLAQDDNTYASLNAGLGRALMATELRATRYEAVDPMLKALPILKLSGDLRRAFLMAESIQAISGGQTAGPEIARQVMEMMPEGSADRARLTARYARLLAAENDDPEKGLAAVTEARRIAESVDDPRMQAQIDLAHARILMSSADDNRALEMAKRAFGIAEELEDQSLISEAAFILVFRSFRVGDSSTSLRFSDIGIDASVKTRDRHGITNAYTAAALTHVLQGDFNYARQLIDKGLEYDSTDSRLMMSKAATGYWKGDYEQADEILTEMVGAAGVDSPAGSMNRNMARVAAAFRLQMTQDPKWGTELATDPLSLDMPRLAQSKLQSDSYDVGLAIVLAGYGGRDDILDEAIRFTGEIKVPFGVLISSVNRYRGLLFFKKGNYTESEAEFAKALESCKQAGYRPELALTLAEYSDMLLDRNEPGDREKAVELQDEAISIATELGMKPLLERVLAKREMLKA